ncbi:AbrB/MazE/SpoVT family DNA-binding domain-containing protein [Desulfosporosinus youngiae]|uniref:Looped-hinge helix DNA binding domain, AbrB family n=1 Tax=Desulfosporosinus youngiae DSM 17734 TaxID=768710 RepID=H5Y3H3_9FIRM|nr:AbrB/MazE/SpoVT family DNA-binding domain-containing protein [Desulfosporosinus youngiae]EHQ89082.1 looped-hinge helix DNA binding domain, AbrB family [Desulfosporosinus youngiae DSM 17734]
MATTISVTIDDFGQILLPLEVNKQLNLTNGDYLKVSIQSNQIVIAPFKSWFDEELNEGLLKALLHEGILIDVE